MLQPAEDDIRARSRKLRFPTARLGGYREGSNVDPAQAMVKMIIGARYYEAAQRSLRTIAESLQLNTRPTTS